MSLIRLRIGYLLALTALVVLAISLFFPSKPTPKYLPVSVAESARGHIAAPGDSQRLPPSSLVGQGMVPALQPLPDSLQGTTPPDGWALLDADGNLLPSPALRALFEYYLSALGEEPLPVLVARIESALATLQEPARGQAQAILGGYLDYRLALADFDEAGVADAEVGEAEQIARKLAEVYNLRRQYLDSQVAEAFFADDEGYDQFQLARLRIDSDESLSAAEREAQLQALEANLPADVREARQQMRRFVDYQQARQALADDPAALQQYREQAFGPEAAERLAALDARQQDWQRRWEAYRQALAALTAAGLAAPEFEQQRQQLRAQYFDAQEQVRVDALDTLNQGNSD
ncbi:MAG: lipase [Marinobacter sp.]|nr:lipase [Marinobacter sp.]